MLRNTPTRAEEQQTAREADAERTPTDEEYEKMRTRGTPYWTFLKKFKPNVVQRCRAGTMPDTFEVYNVDRVLRTNSTLRHQVGLVLYIGKPTLVMVVPTVWVVCENGDWTDTTARGLDDTVVLFTSKDPSLNEFLEEWFQKSRSSMSSAIKSVAMNPVHGYHISVAKYEENKTNLHVTDQDKFHQTTCVEDGQGGYWFLGIPQTTGPGMIIDIEKLASDQDKAMN